MSVAYASTSFGFGSQAPQPSGSVSGRTSRQSDRDSFVSASEGEHELLPMPATTPEPTRTPSPRRLSVATEERLQAQYDAIGSFFGGGRRQSRVPVPAISPEDLETTATPLPAPVPSPLAVPTTPVVESTQSQSQSQTTRPIELVRAQYDAIGAFFGGGRRSSSTPVPPTTESAGATRVPPPYVSDTRSEIDTESLPSYSKVDQGTEKPFNRKLFFFGFLFPPFWLLGMFVPFVAQIPMDPSLDNRSKEEQEADNARLRTVELRWALRCAIALLVLVLAIAIAVVLAIVLTKRG